MMTAIKVEGISKSFGDVKAVVDVSFEVQKGEIFGLLGPNGAGKTTTIRILLDIFRSDSGSVSILGGEMNEQKMDSIGYMPEERGMYQDEKLEICLQYMASLKGMSGPKIREQMESLLHQFDLFEHRHKKVKELSKGMQQKAQIISTIIHEPDLIIIDEPFTALDPVNVQMVKDLILKLKSEGKTIIMSTHQMHQVEALCDRILMIDNGVNVLYGELKDIQRQFAGNQVFLQIDGDLPDLQVDKVEQVNGGYKLELPEGMDSQDLLARIMDTKARIERFEIAIPGMDEIFIKVAREGDKE